MAQWCRLQNILHWIESHFPISCFVTFYRLVCAPNFGPVAHGPAGSVTMALQLFTTNLGAKQTLGSNSNYLPCWCGYWFPGCNCICGTPATGMIRDVTSIRVTLLSIPYSTNYSYSFHMDTPFPRAPTIVPNGLPGVLISRPSPLDV